MRLVRKINTGKSHEINSLFNMAEESECDLTVERVCEFVGGPSPRPSPGGRGSRLVVAVAAVGGPSPRPSPGGRGSRLVPPVAVVGGPSPRPSPGGRGSRLVLAVAAVGGPSPRPSPGGRGSRLVLAVAALVAPAAVAALFADTPSDPLFSFFLASRCSGRLRCAGMMSLPRRRPDGGWRRRTLPFTERLST